MQTQPLEERENVVQKTTYVNNSNGIMQHEKETAQSDSKQQQYMERGASNGTIHDVVKNLGHNSKFNLKEVLNAREGVNSRLRNVKAVANIHDQTQSLLGEHVKSSATSGAIRIVSKHVHNKTSSLNMNTMHLDQENEGKYVDRGAQLHTKYHTQHAGGVVHDVTKHDLITKLHSNMNGLSLKCVRVVENDDDGKENAIDCECGVDNEVVRRQYGELTDVDRVALMMQNAPKLLGWNNEYNMLHEEDGAKEYAVMSVGTEEKDVLSKSLTSTVRTEKMNDGEKTQSEAMREATCEATIERGDAKG